MADYKKATEIIRETITKELGEPARCHAAIPRFWTDSISVEWIRLQNRVRDPAKYRHVDQGVPNRKVVVHHYYN